MKHLFNWRNLFGTITIFMSMWMLSKVALNLDFLNVFEETLSSYNVTDLVFSTSSQLREEAAADTNIVLVNIGNLSRSDIGAQLNIINKYKPAVIGIDTFFPAPKDSLTDALFEEALASTENLVLVSKLIGGKDQPNGEVLWDSLGLSLPRFVKHAETAFANVITDGDSGFETWREEPIKEKLKDGRIEYCLGVKVAEKFHPEAVKRFLERGNITEIINFRGNLDKFVKLDIDDVFEENFTPETIRGKIVLFGYMGDGYDAAHWDEDKYYTPMNEKTVGRTPPDMYGVVVHANIVSMILHEDYINGIPPYWSWIIAFVLCYLNVALFSRINEIEHLEIWYGILTKLIQLAEAIVLFYIIIVAFANYNLKLDLTLAVVAVLLSGDILEFYFGLILNLYYKIRDYTLKVLHKEEVAKSQ